MQGIPLSSSTKTRKFIRTQNFLSRCAAAPRISTKNSETSLIRAPKTLAIALLLLISGCNRNPSNSQLHAIQIQQDWQLQRGDRVAGHPISGGLGDISIDLGGAEIHAPFDGKVQSYPTECVIFSSPEVPAYLLRLCGIQRPKLGTVQEGDVIGAAKLLQFAALRRQPDGKWAMVEPSRDVLERALR